MMKKLRQILLASCMMAALAVAAEQPDPVVSSIQTAYRQAKESSKKNKGMGNEMVTTINYTVRGNGTTTETIHFYFNTVQGTYLLNEGDDIDPHFFYYPLYLVTRSYNIGKKKYNEDYLFEPSSQRLLYVSTQDYDENGKRYERQFYFQDNSIYTVIGPEGADSSMDEFIYYRAEDLRRGFDFLIRNPKE